jgi:hypothetical protein
MEPVALVIAAASSGAALVAAAPAARQERTVKIADFGAKSGVVRSFGINSEAAMGGAADEFSNAGGIGKDARQVGARARCPEGNARDRIVERLDTCEPTR